MADSPFITEANQETFPAHVLEKSHEVPVLVDFWADWCQPCKMLMPVLAKLVDEYQGGFLLVKVNTDEQQELAAAYGVRSLPTVAVFKNGEIVDQFSGVQGEPVIRELIDKHRTRKTEALREQALALYQQGDIEAALKTMQQVVDQEPDYYEAAIELVGLYLKTGDTEKAESLLQSLPENVRDNNEVKALVAKAQMQMMKEEAGDSTELEKQLSENPDDLDALLSLANARIAEENYEEGMLLYLSLMKKDSSFKDEAGRKGLLNVFQILGNTDPLVKKYRGKTFSLLH